MTENYKYEDKENHRIGRLNYGRADYDAMKKYFAHVDWGAFDVTNSINEKWDMFLKIYNDCVRLYVPKVSMKEIGRSDWFNGRCMEAKRKRDRLWNVWRKRKRPDLWRNYKDARNEYVQICREVRKHYEKDIVEKCKDQPKLFYRFVNSKLKNKEGISKLEVDKLEYTKASDMAEIMNDCFQKVFTREDESYNQEERREIENTLDEIQILVEDVERMLSGLDPRKAHGPDGVSNWVLRECSNELSTKIHSMVDCSLREGKVPADWKRANVVPIYKGGKREDPMNYRPVSLTSVVAKICERVVKDKWMKHLEENDMLSGKQFGFRKGRSCTTNLLCFYSRIVDILQERDGWAYCIYFRGGQPPARGPHPAREGLPSGPPPC